MGFMQWILYSSSVHSAYKAYDAIQFLTNFITFVFNNYYESVSIEKMKYCIVPSCKYNCGTSENVKMFRFDYIFSTLFDSIDDLYVIIFSRFPRNEALAIEWTKAIKCIDLVGKPIGGMVCIEHFLEKDFKRNDKHVTQLKSGSIPMVFIGINKRNGSQIDVNQNNDACSSNNQFVGFEDNESNTGDGENLRLNCDECSHKDQQISVLRKENDDLNNMNQKQKQAII